ncbi:MAG TPA: ATP-grasp domain-containing protein [Actinospica sp.]|jgi:hypothetical protein|nr:ATP-grasp domain-containing protein [Actinospica sp.]
MAPSSFLYCCDPLNPRRVDQHFAVEARAVRERGGVVALVDHDALLRGEAERAVERVPVGLGAAWYRGWMVSAGEYVALARGLESRGVELAVAPERYRAAHELPGWYAAFTGLTPGSVWSAGAAPDVAALVSGLRPGAGIVKDYVKSRKHEWDEACFIPDLADAAAVNRIVGRFLELQGDSLAGGVVLREFESFVAAEVRVWWIDGEARLLTPHPDSVQPLLGPDPDLGDVAAAVRRLGCRFVTTDLALRNDGAWRVVEVGDGQVSDLPASIEPGELLGLLIGA